MLISFERNFIYTKTSKTAGTSVEIFFQKACVATGQSVADSTGVIEGPHGIIGFRGRAKPEGTKWWNHMSAHRIREQIGDHIWNEFLKFCCIRNPFDKMVSFYHFTRTPLERQRIRDQPFDVRRAGFLSWLKETRLLYDGDKYLIKGQIAMDDFIRFENLVGDVERIAAKLGMDFDPTCLPGLKMGNRERDEHFSEYYDREAADKVRSRYRFELEYFGYDLID